jgi:hypothetical protein
MRVLKDAVGYAGQELKPAENDVEQFANHAVAPKVTKHEFDLAYSLLNEEGTKVEAAKEGGEEAEVTGKVLAHAKFAEDHGCHGPLDVFELAESKVADWKDVANTSQKDAKVVDPSMVMLAGACGK